MSQTSMFRLCPICNRPMIFQPLENAWFCDNCKQRVQIVSQGIEEMIEVPPSSGTIEVSGYFWRYKGESNADIFRLNQEIKELKDGISEIKTLITNLYSKLDTTPRVVVIEELSKEEARERVINYLDEHQSADTEELMVNLGIELRLLVDILDELRREEKIEPKGE